MAGQRPFSLALTSAVMVGAGVSLAPYGWALVILAALPLWLIMRGQEGTTDRAAGSEDAKLDALAANCGPVAAGDLRVRFEEIEGDAGDLARALNAALSRLDGAMGSAAGQTHTLSRAAAEMSQASGQARAAVAEISATISNVADGASEQAMIAERAANAIEQIHHGLAEVAGHGAAASAAAAEADEVAGEGAQTLGSAEAAILDISESVSQTTTVVSELGERATAIGEIVSAIENIAQQTNLLALNASIEAARAGESGRGFAVVAEEVRKLAEDTQQQVGSISEIIGSIQSAAREAIEVSASGVSAAEAGTQQMEQVAAAFGSIRSQIAAVVEGAERVAGQTAQLQVTSDGVRDEMSSVAAVAQENAAAAQQVAASSTETTTSVDLVDGASAQVAAAVEVLDELVAGFQVSVRDHSAAQTVGGEDLAEVVRAALSAHAAWKDRLHTAIAEGASELDPTNVSKDDVCPFGVWLHGPEGTAHDHDDAYRQIHDLHADFHVVAARVLEMATSGQAEAAEREMAVGSDFHRVSSELSRALKNWKA